jgi:hypothetical protein
MQLEIADIFYIVAECIVLSLASRYLLDLATAWLKNERRDGILFNVLIGWSIAALLAGYILASGIGVVCAGISAIWNALALVSERAERFDESIRPDEIKR